MYRQILATSILILALTGCDSADDVPDVSADDITFATVTGTATYRERIALSPDATASIKLLDVSLQDVPAIELAATELANLGQVPFEFELTYVPEFVDEKNSYVVRAEIRDRGRLMFTTDTAYPVLTRNGGTHVDMMLVRVKPFPVSDTGVSLINTQWKLTELRGQPVTVGLDQQAPYLKLINQDDRLEGYGGCNNIRGGFTIEDDGIRFGLMAMTAMACADTMELETNFTQALGEMNGYTLEANTLSGLSDETVILRFEAAIP